MASENLKFLEKFSTSVLFSCDATRLETYPVLEKVFFDKIVFNFPDVGTSGTLEAVEQSQTLIREFMKSAKSKLSEKKNSQILISLRDTKYYNSWKIVEIGKTQGLSLLRKELFSIEDFPGYQPVRTISDQTTRKAPDYASAYYSIFQRFARGKKRKGKKEKLEVKSEKEELQ